MSFKPVKITDTSFRDGHQSILATRMRTEDILPLVARMDRTGVYSMEVWGGATFDVCTRFLGEDPWERLQAIREAAPNTKLQMLLRGQNLVGYRNYADDVVEAFVRNVAQCGLDIFRVFDALNDPRNFQAAFKAIKKEKKHIQACLSYSLTERRLGGDVFNIAYFVSKAKRFAEMGADSICIKDMAGLIAPQDSFDLVSALKSQIGLPVQLHTHYTSGMASMSLLKAIEAGVDIIDCALSPFSMRTSQPSLEAMIGALTETDRDPGLKLEEIIGIARDLEKVAPRYRDYLNDTKMSVIETGVLEHQVPGGMLSNLVSQLREANALDKLEQVYAELPVVRKDLGTCPLVTPTSQIVGIQAVQNVLFGRYKMISGQVKDYCYGLYGRPPLEIDPKLRSLALKGYPRGETPIDCRPGDILEPELDKAREEIGDLARDERDQLTYCLYPTTGKRFLEWKYEKAEMPDEVAHGKSMTQVKKENKLIEMVKSGEISGEPHMDLSRSHTIRMAIEGLDYEVQFAQVGNRPVFGAPMAAMAAMPAVAPVAMTGGTDQDGDEDGDEVPMSGTQIKAPMPGVIIKHLVNVGDQVTAGQTILVLEAMKMENEIHAQSAGKVLKLHQASGANVNKDQVLVTIGGE